MILHLVLVLSMLAPPTEEAASAAFAAGDLERALELYSERATAPDVHGPDALAGAQDCLLALHRREPENVGHICRALELARDVQARDDLRGEDERTFWAELEAKDAALAGDRCAEVEAGQGGAAKTGTAEPSTGQPAKVEAEGPKSLPVLKDIQCHRPPVRVAIGSTFVAVGAALLGGMTGVLVGRARADATIADITAGAQGREFTPDERRAAHEANDRYVRLDAIWPGLLAAGIVSVATGVSVILAPHRGASQRRVRAGGAGVVYSF